MKSSSTDLEKRGYIPDDSLQRYEHWEEDKLRLLLESGVPRERTAAVKILAGTRKAEYLPILCTMLSRERKLYTKIALCEGIVLYGHDAVFYLIPLLGKIGGNQHRSIGNYDLKKKAYPLPRDIAARVLVRLGPSVLPDMRKILQNGDTLQIPEALDVIGHVTWYSGDESCREDLLRLFEEHRKDEFLRWKIIRALQSFRSGGVLRFLEGLQEEEVNPVIGAEIGRSISRIRQRTA